MKTRGVLLFSCKSSFFLRKVYWKISFSFWFSIDQSTVWSSYLNNLSDSHRFLSLSLCLSLARRSVSFSHEFRRWKINEQISMCSFCRGAISGYEKEPFCLWQYESCFEIWPEKRISNWSNLILVIVTEQNTTFWNKFEKKKSGLKYCSVKHWYFAHEFEWLRKINCRAFKQRRQGDSLRLFRFDYLSIEPKSNWQLFDQMLIH